MARVSINKLLRMVMMVTVMVTLCLCAVMLTLDIPSPAEFNHVLQYHLPGPFGIFGRVPASRVRIDVVLDTGLYRPLALAFNPKDLSLWIVNHDNDSSVIIDNVLREPSEHIVSRFFDRSRHFMRRPTSISFSQVRDEFVTTQETVNDYAKGIGGHLFMGPTLFTSDRKLYEGGNLSHWDMLHHSPLGMGTALGINEDCREYFVFNGYNNSIDQYCFNEPHPLGGIDHSDGLTIRHAAGELKRREGVPGHMQMDRRARWLYVADTGNGRIVRLFVRNAAMQELRKVKTKIKETILWELPDSHVQSVTDGQAGLVAPAGLLLVDEHYLVVSDYATGHLKAFTVNGQLVGDVDTGLGPDALAGLATPAFADSIQSGAAPLFAVDAKRNRVIRITILPKRTGLLSGGD